MLISKCKNLSVCYILGLALIFVLSGCNSDKKLEGSADSGAVSSDTSQSNLSVTVNPPIKANTDSAKKFIGPFGLARGMTLEQVLSATNAKPIAGNPMDYNATVVPTPYEDFESYSFVISPKQGLCKVAAIGKDISADSFGSAVHSSFDSLDEQLTKKYGKSAGLLDAVKPGSMWQEPQYWMMGLDKQERYLTDDWSSKKNPLPDNLEDIVLQAKASSTNVGYLLLSYEFDNFSSCLDERKDATSKGL